mmetsp:Transcript_10427/g.17204  ORF Transcript_10427/g.17204 Transcript_10427/m.17204 type:complete len:92 (-) Transcript_10427:611-886(-)
MTRMRSASWACATLWVVKITVRTLLACKIDFSTACSLSGSSALVGSSSNKSAGFRTRARASATRCFCPPESEEPAASIRVSNPSGSCCMKS